MLNDREKLASIRDLCRHPGSFHWNGRQMADAITRIIDSGAEVDADAPIPYELAHDAVYEEIEDSS